MQNILFHEGSNVSRSPYLAKNEQVETYIFTYMGALFTAREDLSDSLYVQHTRVNNFNTN